MRFYLHAAYSLLHTFWKRHGQFAHRDGFAVDGNGNYQPWYTYPALEWLAGLDVSDKTVFEYGSGASTLYWGKRAKSITTVEFNRSWYEVLKPHILPNTTLILEPNNQKYPEALNTQYDIIVIDGSERTRCTELALRHVAPDGMILFDNAEWYTECTQMLADAGLIEIRFNGFTPINSFAATSSMFLTRTFAFPTTPAARGLPVGGRPRKRYG